MRTYAGLNNCAEVLTGGVSNEQLEFFASATDSGGGGLFDDYASRLMRARLLESNLRQCCQHAAFGSLFRVSARTAALFALLLYLTQSHAVEPFTAPFATDPASSRETQADATRRLPMQQLNRETQALISDVVDKPSFFRRMPTQNIDCDPQMFEHLVRYPEVLVNIWDVMGITKVQVNRTGPYTFTADDGVGTTCKCDLVFGNDKIHIYYGTGAYKGTMAPRQITGRCVCVLYSNIAKAPNGTSMINGSMDVFLKLDNFGADLLTRTLSPLVGKTADYNFVESAKFLSQISQVCERNPAGAQILASKLTKVHPQVRDEFARIAHRIGNEASNSMSSPQLASIGPDGLKPAPRNSSDTNSISSTEEFYAARQSFTDAHSELSNQLNPQRVPPVTLSDAPNSYHEPAVSVTRPTSIVPAKPNIYMRR